MHHSEQLEQPSHGITDQQKIDVLTGAYAQILKSLGVDQSSEHFKGTASRAAKAILEMSQPKEFVLKVFSEPSATGLIFQNGIFISSLCPHHILPWFGTACIAVLPFKGKILGLSKFSRLARYHAAGLKTQEEVTHLIGTALTEHEELNPTAVGVSIRAYHTCQSLRGARETRAVTTTQYLSGLFGTNAAARAEFLSVVEHPNIC